MPESDSLVLPGIDPTPGATPEPAAPAQTPAPAATVGLLPTVTPSPPASEEPAAPGEEGANADEAQQPQERKARPGVHNRIDELVGRERDASRRADRLEGLLERVLTGVLSPQRAVADAGTQQLKQPNKADYQTWEAYNEALIDYKSDVRFNQRMSQLSQQNAERNRQAQEQHQKQTYAGALEQLHTILGTQIEGAIAKYPDYAEVVGAATWEMPVNVEAAMAMSGSGGDVAYYLAQNPGVVAKLSRLPDMALATQMSRIAHAMQSGAVRFSSAPPPGKPSGERGSGPMDYPANATPEEHLKWEAQRKARKSQARA